MSNIQQKIIDERDKTISELLLKIAETEIRNKNLVVENERLKSEKKRI